MKQKKPRRYPPNGKTHTLAARYVDKATGDLILLYQIDNPTITVRIPAEDLNKENWWRRPKRVKV
jgi:hypothetical protein